jgi:glycosyltransferase involved in cell wall biosynthesis
VRICLLANAASVHTQRWAEHFAENGHDVHVVSVRDARIRGVKVHPVRIRQGVDSISLPAILLSYTKMLLHIKRIVNNIDPDILHAHYATTNGLIGAFAGFHPYIVSTWGSDIFDPPSTSFIFKKIIKFALSKADAITATSKILTTGTQKLAPQGRRVQTIPFGVDLAKFKPAMKPHSDKITIGCAKTLVKLYGVEYLIKAFASVYKKFPQTNLLIVGGGPLHNCLKKLADSLSIGNSVDFVGPVPHDDMPLHLGKMHIFVVPSLSEAWGRAAAEASAMELPVVASAVGGLPEVIIDGVTGFLVTPRDHQVIAQKLIWLIENPALRSSMGTMGRKFVMDNYDWNANASLMEKLYYSLSAHRKDL